MPIRVISTPGGLMATHTDYEYRMCDVPPIEKYNITDLLMMQSKGKTLTIDEKKLVIAHAEKIRVQRSKNKRNGRRK